jgi:hypothetical protein
MILGDFFPPLFCVNAAKPSDEYYGEKAVQRYFSITTGIRVSLKNSVCSKGLRYAANVSGEQELLRVPLKVFDTQRMSPVGSPFRESSISSAQVWSPVNSMTIRLLARGQHSKGRSCKMRPQL